MAGPCPPIAIVVVDRPGAGSGCSCAGAANPELPRFAGDLDWLRWEGAQVSRRDPRDWGMTFEDLPAARRVVDQRGIDALPLVLADGVVVHSGSYPSRERLRAILEDARVARGVTPAP